MSSALAPLADLAAQPYSSASSNKSSVARQQSALPSIPTCSLCKQPISDPWTLIESGESFDKACVEQWLEENNTCPITGTVLETKTLVPNFILRDIVNSGLKEGAPVVCPLGVAPVEKLVRNSPSDSPVGLDEQRSSTLYDSMHSSGDGYTHRGDDASSGRQSSVARTTSARNRAAVMATQYDTLMELLGSDMPDLQEDALRVLLSALRNDAHSCDNFIKQGVILGVVAVLNNGSSQSQSMAIDVLAMVMEMGPPETATVLLDAGVVQSLISMLLSPSALVQQQAVGLVSIIASRYAVAVALCEEGALGPLVQYLLGENVLAKEYASTALASIARQEESLVKHIAATPDAIRVLAQLLRSSSVVCQQNATFILGRIASLGGEYEAEIACTTVISPVVQLLYFGSTPDIKLFAAQLLATICETSSKTQQLVIHAGAASPLFAMLAGDEPTLQLAAGRLLVYLDQSGHKDLSAAFKVLDKDSQKRTKAQAKAHRLKLKL